MELDRAKEIVQALADGVDPYMRLRRRLRRHTAVDRFPADGPYQRADTVRALYAIMEAAASGHKPKKPIDPNKPRAGQGNRPPDPSPKSQPGPVDPEDCTF